MTQDPLNRREVRSLIQIEQCLPLLKEILGDDLLAIYLYGSAVVGGLQRYSDLDLFVVSNRGTTREEKSKLVTALLEISKERPIEMTIVEKAAVNPWRYPPRFDFQYGEWLREEFESGNVEPWPSKKMPDLALLITQVLLANETLVGDDADQLLCEVPHHDVIHAMRDGLSEWMAELESDTRNVLLALARIWTTMETGSIVSKSEAAEWVMDRLPEEYRPVMERAKAIYMGEEDYWDDLQESIKPCADFIYKTIIGSPQAYR